MPAPRLRVPSIAFGGCMCNRPVGRYVMGDAPAFDPGWWQGGSNWSLSPFVFGVVDRPVRAADVEQEDEDELTPRERRARRRALMQQRRAEPRARPAPRQRPQVDPEVRAARAARAAETARKVARTLLDLAPDAMDAASALVARVAPAEGNAAPSADDFGGDRAGVDASGMSVGDLFLPTEYDAEWFGPEGNGDADSFRDDGFSWQMVQDPLYGDMALFGANDAAPGGVLATTKALLWPTKETWLWWRARMAKGDYTEALASAWADAGEYVSDQVNAARVAAATERFGRRLLEIRGSLDAMKAAMLPQDKLADVSPEQRAFQQELAVRFNKLNARYFALATPFYAECYPLDAATGQPAVSTAVVSAVTRAVGGSGAAANKLLASIARSKPMRGARGRTSPGLPTGVAGVLYGHRATFGECILARDFRRQAADADFGAGVAAVVPTLLVIGALGVAVTLAGRAWAVAREPEVKIAEAQRAANSEWLLTNAALIREGLSPVPAPPSINSGGDDGLKLLAGGAALALVLAVFLGKKGR